MRHIPQQGGSREDKRKSLGVGTLGVALALASESVFATSLRLTDLGPLGGQSILQGDMNASGQVTGNFRTAEPERQVHAFLWDGTTLRDLGTLGGRFSDGLAINASGQVTGYSQTADLSVFHAFFWDGTTMRDLGTLGGAIVVAAPSTPRGR